MSKKTTYSVLIVIVLVILAFSLFEDRIMPSAQTEAVKIGALIPLSGPGATLGEWMKKGVLEAQAEINASGGVNGKPLDIVIEDDTCLGKTAVTAYRKLYDVDNIRYFVGPLCAAARIPVLKASEQDKSLIVTTGLAVTYGQDTIAKTFNVLPSVGIISEKIITYAFDHLGSKKISLLVVDDEFGKEAEIVFSKVMQSKNIQGFSIEKYPKGTSDMRTQLTKLAANDSDTILVGSFTPEYAVFMKQASELGINKKFIALSPIQAPDVAKANIGTNLKIYYPHPATPRSASAQKFLQTYMAKDPSAGSTSPVYLGSGYDAVNLAVLAIKKCGDDVSCAENTLKNLISYQGANGAITFGEKGNVNSAESIEIRVLESGKFTPLE